MPHPFTRAQAVENRAFLDILARTGNARLAAREIGKAPATMHNRRSANAAFAQAWEAAAAAAHARFYLSGGRRGPAAEPGAEGSVKRGRKKVDTGLRRDDGEGGSPAAALAEGPLHHRAAPGGPPPRAGEELRTKGGESVVVRTRKGKLQLRPAHKGKLTKAAEQAFLAALSATANIRLSAAAAGASPAAFYRRRNKNPGFAREFRLALAMGYERLEMACLAAARADSHEDDQWRHAAPPPIPPMSANQALQLLFLHEKSVRQGWDKPHRRRRGETDERYSMRLFLMWRAEQRQIGEEAALRRAARYEETGDWRHEEEAPAPELPPLELVTGWSRAKGGPRHDPDVALFGGWRLADMKRKLGEKK